MSLYEQLKLLYDQELHSNVVSFASMLISVSESSPDVLTYQTKYQTYVYYGNSLFYLKEYKKAEAIYRKALQLKKSFAKTKGKAQPFPPGEVTSEVDVKYKCHLCYIQMKMIQQAASILEGIAGKQRTPAVNMALAKLYHQTGNERAAITTYKEVLRECPFAVEASQGLLTLGVKGSEVAAMMLSNCINSANVEWLSMWVKAHSHIHSREVAQAIATFKQIDMKTHLRDNVEVIVSLGEVYYYNGDYQNALITLERAHSLDPLLLKGMDVYAALLCKENKQEELENLAAKLVSLNDSLPEPWIAMGYFYLSSKKLNKAGSFAHKAVCMAPRHVEALLLKGSVLLELKRPTDAIAQFGEAYKIAPSRYEAHKGLVECYLAMHRTREAVAIASSACKQLNQSARSLSLYATVLTKDPLSTDKAKQVLEKALKQDPTHLDAVYLLATIYEQERLYEKGIELLKKHIEQQTSCQLHQMLGDFLSRTNEHERALHHFSIALELDPSNHKAAEGSQRVEQNPETSESYDVDDICDSENERKRKEQQKTYHQNMDYTIKHLSDIAERITSSDTRYYGPVPVLPGGSGGE